MNEHPTNVVIDATEAAANRERGWWRDATLYDDVAAAAARHPDKVAIVGHRHASGGVASTVDVLIPEARARGRTVVASGRRCGAPSGYW